MLYPTEDAWGHCLDEQQVSKLTAALEVLNESEVIGAMEENANHHSAADFRREMIDSLHVADIDGWERHDDYESATCKICDGELEREI